MDDKRVLDKQIFEDGFVVMLADPLDATDDLPLGHTIDGVDVVDPFVTVLVALMGRIHAQVTRSSLGIRAASLTVTTTGRYGLVHGAHTATVDEPLTEPVQVCHRDAAQSLELLTAVDRRPLA